MIPLLTPDSLPEAVISQNLMHLHQAMERADLSVIRDLTENAANLRWPRFNS